MQHAYRIKEEGRGLKIGIRLTSGLIFQNVAVRETLPLFRSKGREGDRINSTRDLLYYQLTIRKKEGGERGSGKKYGRIDGSLLFRHGIEDET